ncbi:MAG: creatininase family protein [Actinomycetota bacterium]
MTSSRRLADLRAPEISERLGPGSVIVQPVGAVEQHGPHLPFNTDLIVAEAAAAALVDRHGDEHDLWLLPALPYSKSNEHAWSAGSIWFGPETMLAMLRDLGRSIATLPCRRLVFLNGHGGNSSLLNVACRELRLHNGLLTFLAHPQVPRDQGGPSYEHELGMGIHGGMGETSMMLHLRPDLVDMSKADRWIPESLTANDHVRFGGSVTFGWLSNDWFDEGVIGDPRTATAEHGRELFDAAVANLGRAMAEVAAYTAGPAGEPGANG